jgi:hypothetical protein
MSMHAIRIHELQIKQITQSAYECIAAEQHGHELMRMRNSCSQLGPKVAVHSKKTKNTWLLRRTQQKGRLRILLQLPHETRCGGGGGGRFAEEPPAEAEAETSVPNRCSSSCLCGGGGGRIVADLRSVGGIGGDNDWPPLTDRRYGAPSLGS